MLPKGLGQRQRELEKESITICMQPLHAMKVIVTGPT